MARDLVWSGAKRRRREKCETWRKGDSHWGNPLPVDKPTGLKGAVLLNWLADKAGLWQGEPLTVTSGDTRPGEERGSYWYEGNVESLAHTVQNTDRYFTRGGRKKKSKMCVSYFFYPLRSGFIKLLTVESPPVSLRRCSVHTGWSLAFSNRHCLLEGAPTPSNVSSSTSTAPCRWCSPTPPSERPAGWSPPAVGPGELYSSVAGVSEMSFQTTEQEAWLHSQVTSWAPPPLWTKWSDTS